MLVLEIHIFLWKKGICLIQESGGCSMLNLCNRGSMNGVCVCVWRGQSKTSDTEQFTN